MAQNPAFRIIRVTLSPNVVTPITPPMANAHRVMVNAAQTDVTIATEASAATEYLKLSTGFEREFELDKYVFRCDAPSFWLLSVTGGLVILEWF